MFLDAGKSTIGGHVMYLTGQVDKRTLEKYEREAKEKNRETWLEFILVFMCSLIFIWGVGPTLHGGRVKCRTQGLSENKAMSCGVLT